MKATGTFPGETGTVRVQCMSQSYIKYKGGHGVPLCSLLMSVAFSMYAMYADILAGSEGVVVFVGKRPDRIVNPMVVYLFMGNPVKWVFLDDSDSCKNDGCPKMPEGVFGGTGRTMLEWVLTDGFLEVIRNEQVRQDIRTRTRRWP